MRKNEQKYHINTKHGFFSVSIWYDVRDKAYLVRALNLPDVVTFGKTLAEAKRMAKDALELYCDSVTEQGKIVIDDARKIIGPLPKSRAGVFSLQA
ncbi:MAG: type II toxin-antitoxin system HicB family antitoxin [Patescibacteria group bacterium]